MLQIEKLVVDGVTQVKRDLSSTHRQVQLGQRLVLLHAEVFVRDNKTRQILPGFDQQFDVAVAQHIEVLQSLLVARDGALSYCCPLRLVEHFDAPDWHVTDNLAGLEDFAVIILLRTQRVFINHD